MSRFLKDQANRSALERVVRTMGEKRRFMKFLYFQEFIRKKSEAMRKNVDSERLLTLQFLRDEGHQRYSLRDSSTSRDAIIARNLSTKFLSRR